MSGILASGRVHLIGVGGAGMSAIAKVLLERGAEVSGSDLKTSRVSMMLEALGADIHIGHEASLVDGAGTVIVSTAIPERNLELQRARELGITVLTRGAALAAVLSGSRSIVVSGTHGKTTTTSMIATVLRESGADPTYLIGAGLNDAGTNARAGAGDLSVAESDESDGSFLLLEPEIAVVTNVELDHVDHWGSIEELRDAFGRFLASVPPGGVIVVPTDDDDLKARSGSLDKRVITFGPGGDVDAENVEHEGDGTRFLLRCDDAHSNVHLRVPGTHNVSNALAAAAALHAVGVDTPTIANGLGAYRGVERRFQIKGVSDGVTVIDDYAHHPTEIAATLSAAQPGPWDRVIAVFQPHRYSRTAALAREFGAAFSEADRVVLMDVYGAGEEAVPGVTGKLVADSVATSFPGRPVAFFPHRADLIEYLLGTVRPGDALLTMGAGDVTTVGEEFLSRRGASS